MKPPEEERKNMPYPVFLKEFGNALRKDAETFFTTAPRRFEEMTPAEQEKYFERLSITGCVAAMFVLQSLFYYHLPPIVRVLVVPVLIGVAWWAGARLVPKLFTKEGRAQLIQQLNVLEFFQLIEAIKFSAITLMVAAIPFWLMPSQFVAAINQPYARTLFLCMFIWNLIGAPLYAQAKSGNARLLIILVFGVPAATVTVWWVYFLMLLANSQP